MENLKIILTKEDKNIILPKEYELLEKNEDIYMPLKLLKILQKLRNFNVPEYSLPEIEWEGLINEENHKKLRITLPNDEIIKKYEYKISEKKFYLNSGEYKWPTGKKYIGNFKNNVFDSDCSNLKYKNIWEYIGAFKKEKLKEKENLSIILKGNIFQEISRKEKLRVIFFIMT